MKREKHNKIEIDYINENNEYMLRFSGTVEKMAPDFVGLASKIYEIFESDQGAISTFNIGFTMQAEEQLGELGKSLLQKIVTAHNKVVQIKKDIEK